MTTAIEWVKDKDGKSGETWNPITGCSKCSPGCKNCYAERMAKRLKAMGQPQYQNVVDNNGWTGQIEFVKGAFLKPIERKKPTTYFVNSMSDLFHEGLDGGRLWHIFHIMNSCPQHIFQILTKRSERLLELSSAIEWTENIWMGVSVENAKYIYRINHLRKTGAALKFLSLEPLLGPLPDLDLSGIDWVIVGGESGPGARPMHPNWARDIRDQCLQVDVPFFFKQWGGWSPSNPGTAKGNAPRYAGFLAEDGHFIEKISDSHSDKAYQSISYVRKKQAGSLLDGREWKEMPGGGKNATINER